MQMGFFAVRGTQSKRGQRAKRVFRGFLIRPVAACGQRVPRARERDDDGARNADARRILVPGGMEPARPLRDHTT